MIHAEAVVSARAVTMKVKHAAPNLPTLFYKCISFIDQGRGWLENKKGVSDCPYLM